MAAKGVSHMAGKALAAVTPLLFEDEGLAEAATYRRYAGSAYDQGLARAVAAYQDHPVAAVRLADAAGTAAQHSAESGFSGRRLSVLVQRDELPEDWDSSPALADLLVLSGVAYRIAGAQPVLDTLALLELEG